MTRIRQKLALNLPLSEPESVLLSEIRSRLQLKPREEYVFDGTTTHVVRTNVVDDVFDAVKIMAEVHKETQPKTMKYFGSVDPITAANFAQESGHAVGTKAFAKYAKKKLASDYKKFSVWA